MSCCEMMAVVYLTALLINSYPITQALEKMNKCSQQRGSVPSHGHVESATTEQRGAA